MAVDLKESKPFWRKHLGALIVGGFAPLPPLVGLGRSPVVGLHVRVGLQGGNDALRLSARVARDLLAHHVRRAGGNLLRRSA